jgi:hypothetical protein
VGLPVVGFADEADSAFISGAGDNSGLGVAAVMAAAASLLAVDLVDVVDGVEDVD